MSGCGSNTRLSTPVCNALGIWTIPLEEKRFLIFSIRLLVPCRQASPRMPSARTIITPDISSQTYPHQTYHHSFLSSFLRTGFTGFDVRALACSARGTNLFRVGTASLQITPMLTYARAGAVGRLQKKKQLPAGRWKIESVQPGSCKYHMPGSRFAGQAAEDRKHVCVETVARGVERERVESPRRIERLAGLKIKKSGRSQSNEIFRSSTSFSN